VRTGTSSTRDRWVRRTSSPRDVPKPCLDL
jgi:hypothetical protein